MRHTYACAECGARAAEIVVSAGEVRRDAHTGVMIMPVVPELRERIAAALADPAALLAINLELAPFWCPQCAASYCADHWRREMVTAARCSLRSAATVGSVGSRSGRNRAASLGT